MDFDKKKRMNEQKKETQQLKKTMKNENLPNVNVLLPDEMRWALGRAWAWGWVGAWVWERVQRVC